MNQMEMLEAARRKYHDDQVQPTVLEVLLPGNAYLHDLVDSFQKKVRSQTTKPRIVCLYELESTNAGRIVGKQDRIVCSVNTAYDAHTKNIYRDSWSFNTLTVSIFPSQLTSARYR